MRLSKNSASVTLVLGDITEFTSDAVVNPANKYLVMGGGVAGAIKKKGGEEIELEARRYAPIEIGEAVVTSAGGLKCRAVIHAPTVESPGGRSTRNYVYRATLAALKVARELGFKSIAFPLMDAGVGGLSPEESIDAMSRAFLEAGEKLEIYVYVTKLEVLEAVSSHMLRSGWREHGFSDRYLARFKILHGETFYEGVIDIEQLKDEMVKVKKIIGDVEKLVLKNP